MIRKHSMQRNGYEVSVEHQQGVIRPVLMVRPRGTDKTYKVATFVSEETAEWFIKQMSKMLGRREEEQP